MFVIANYNPVLFKNKKNNNSCKLVCCYSFEMMEILLRRFLLHLWLLP
jgi:hypothetical protein